MSCRSTTCPPTRWQQGDQLGGGSVKAFPGLPIEIRSSSIAWEVLIDFSGEFFFAMTVASDIAKVEYGYKFIISNEILSASVFGSIEWSANIDYKGLSVGGKAKATFEAEVAIETDDDGDVHLAGSISASGRLTARIGGKTKELFDGSIDASVRRMEFRFRFPLGVGSLERDLL